MTDRDREFLLYLGEAVGLLLTFQAQGGAAELRADKFYKELESYREFDPVDLRDSETIELAPDPEPDPE